MQPRSEAIKQVAEVISKVKRPHPVRVAIDGATAAGKTTLANELAERLEAIERTTIRASLDGFHRPRAERYARGRESAEGYYYDAFNHGAIVELLLRPLGPSGDHQYVTSSLDLALDSPIHQDPKLATSDMILLVDGTFLQRPELAPHWDLVLFVQVSPPLVMQRGIKRDAEAMGGESMAKTLYRERYTSAYEIYEATCDPTRLADIIFGNDDFAFPNIELR